MKIVWKRCLRATNDWWRHLGFLGQARAQQLPPGGAQVLIPRRAPQFGPCPQLAALQRTSRRCWPAGHLGGPLPAALARSALAAKISSPTVKPSIDCPLWWGKEDAPGASAASGRAVIRTGRVCGRPSGQLACPGLPRAERENQPARLTAAVAAHPRRSHMMDDVGYHRCLRVCYIIKHIGD